ncbi:transposase [bacterium]|nr:transposase [bacterium]
MAVRKYDQGFKEEAVRLLLTSGKQLKEIAEDLGIHPSTLREWRNAYWARQEAGNSHEEDPATTKALADKMKNLQKENDLLRRQRDILKKALGILSERSPGDMP